jgi:hypothetical protein
LTAGPELLRVRRLHRALDSATMAVSLLAGAVP